MSRTRKKHPDRVCPNGRRRCGACQRVDGPRRKHVQPVAQPHPLDGYVHHTTRADEHVTLADVVEAVTA